LTTCFLLPGRSGHVVALALLALAAWWALPDRLRWLALAAPILLLGLLFAASPKTLDRVQLGVAEAKQFQAVGNVNSSIGERLHYWTVSLELIAQKPVFGHGLGSWNHAYLKQLQGRTAPAHSAGIRNPHQEYLLWGVQMGAIGIALLLAWFASAAWTARNMQANAKQAVHSAIIGAMLACLFNAAIWDALIGDFLVCAIGLAMALGHSQLEQRASA
jgi:O-antigen ligase